MVLAFLGPKPNLWMSAEIEVTPSTAKSNLHVEVAELDEEGQNVAAEAGVDVEADVVLARERGERSNRIDDALREGGRAADNENGVARDEATHGVDLRRGRRRRPARGRF
jgi:hypothetical protein